MCNYIITLAARGFNQLKANGCCTECHSRPAHVAGIVPCCVIHGAGLWGERCTGNTCLGDAVDGPDITLSGLLVSLPGDCVTALVDAAFTLADSSTNLKVMMKATKFGAGAQTKELEECRQREHVH